MPRMVDLIGKKRDGGELSPEEIAFIIRGMAAGEIPDYQLSAWLMAVCFQGLSMSETLALTAEMRDSGDIVDLSAIPGVKVDKHSTGGVGDKTSLVLGPLVAATGAPVAKLSGRALGHTGGTVDKLESIRGFHVELSTDDFIQQVKDIGIAIIGQSPNLVPADKKLYALRDVTGTVKEMGLIASSIMSKKLAGGADAIVLDVKVGSGAFMKNIEEARKLGETMVGIGKGMGRETRALITSMEQPLGLAVGNALEVREAILTLQGKGPADLLELCMALGVEMLLAGGFVVENSGLAVDSVEIENSESEGNPHAGWSMHDGKPFPSPEAAALDALTTALESGAALAKMREWVVAQGGDGGQIDDPSLLPLSACQREILAPTAGIVNRLEAEKVGQAALLLGAGRKSKEDVIDYGAGIVLAKKVGDKVKKGEVLATLYAKEVGLLELGKGKFLEGLGIGVFPKGPAAESPTGEFNEEVRSEVGVVLGRVQ